MAESIDVSPCKKAKLKDGAEMNGHRGREEKAVSRDAVEAGPEMSAENPASDLLEKFQVVRVLNHLRERRCIFLLAKDKVTDEENAVIKLEKTAFTEDVAEMNRVCSGEVSSSVQFNNDIYTNFTTVPVSKSLIEDVASIKTSLIYPATEKHIVKYQAQVYKLSFLVKRKRNGTNR